MAIIDDVFYIFLILFSAINGRMYGNLEGLLMCKGDNVVWNILGVGRSIDLHTAYFHGNNFLHRGMYRDTVTVVPSILYSVTMKAENEGKFGSIYLR